MPSSSTSSDVDPARVLAREQHHILQQPSTPPPKECQDSTVLSSIGSHLNNTPEPDSWPSSIENLTDEEISSQSYPPTPRLHVSSLDDDSRTSHGRTRLVDVTYLPAAQYKLFYHQRTSERTMRNTGDRSSEPSPTRLPASNIDAIEYRTHRGEAPERTHHVHIAFSASHTAPPMSVDTAEGDLRVSAQLPRPDDPWSSINTTSERRCTEDQDANYTVARGHREHFRTPMS